MKSLNSVKQRSFFIALILIVGFTTHFAYRVLKPQWVIFEQAESSYQRKDWNSAIALYEESFAKGLYNPVAMLRIAEAYSKIKNYPKAIYWYQAYLKINPNDADVRRALAGAFSGNNEFEKAEMQLKLILEEKSQNIQPSE